MQGPVHENPKWLYVKYDSVFNPSRVFHIEFYWLSSAKKYVSFGLKCFSGGEALAIEELLNQWFRRGTKLGLKLVQIPEYFCEANLQIHPFRAQPYIAPMFPQDDGSVESQQLALINLKIRSLHVEKTVLADCPNEWIRDEDRKTDWNNYGQFDSETESLISGMDKPPPSQSGVAVAIGTIEYLI
jgi:hypothetical protein